MSERFYLNCPLGPGEVVLEGPEAHHLGVVCRLGPGDPLCLFNGDGHEYPARVLSVTRRQVHVEIQAVETPLRELDFRLEVAAPLPRGDRAQFLIEKLTELGVTAFVPLATRRSVVQPGQGKLDKLHRYVIEACKQCGRNVLMEIAPLTYWETYGRQAQVGQFRILAHPNPLSGKEGNGKGSEHPVTKNTSMGGKLEFHLAVGPEGGFTEEEINIARSAGWKIIDLGPRILRVETAALLLTAWALEWISKPAQP